MAEQQKQDIEHGDSISRLNVTVESFQNALLDWQDAMENARTSQTMGNAVISVSGIGAGIAAACLLLTALSIIALIVALTFWRVDQYAHEELQRSVDRVTKQAQLNAVQINQLNQDMPKENH